MRLDQLAIRMGDAVAIEWRSFLLRTEPKTTDREKFVAYTRSWLRPAEMEPAAEFRVWSSDDPPPSSSLPAQIAAKVMAAFGPDVVASYHHRLLRAYFAENRDISAWATLADLATDIGVDRREFETLVSQQQDEVARLVIDEHNDAIDQGITAVPTVLINGVLPVPGAQDVDTYEHWISRIIERAGR